MNTKKYLVIIVPLLLIALIDCTNSSKTEKMPRAQRGVLDLTKWDFEKDGSVRLDGEWEFYWEQLLGPEDFKNESQPEKSGYIKVPGKWNGYKVKGKKISWKGYATYRLTIKAKSTEIAKALEVIEINTAYKLWVNDSLVAKNGVVGKSKEEMKPQFLYQAVGVPSDTNTIDIVIQVSNFYYDIGGIYVRIILGNINKINNKRIIQYSLKLFLIGSFFAMAFYHLALFYLGKFEKSLLYIGILCLLYMLPPIVCEERLIMVWNPDFNWIFLMRLNKFVVYVGMPIFLLFFNSLFSININKRLLNAFIIVSMLFLTASLVLPTHFEHRIFNYSILLIFGWMAYVIRLLIITSLQHRSSAFYLLYGFIIIIIVGINDILYELSIIQTNFYLSFAMLIFILISEVAIHKKFVQAEKKVQLHREQLIHAEKLSSLGTLIASVAHEINNPNNSIMLTSQSIQDTWNHVESALDDVEEEQEGLQIGWQPYVDIKKKVPEAIQRLIRNSRRINTIVKDLKAFAKKGTSEINESININDVVKSSITLLENKIKNSTNNFTLSYGEDMPTIKGNFQRLEQVIINLVQNACQALPDREKGIVASTSFDKIESQITVSIQDEGSGIPKNKLKNIFDPFYTTKHSEEGTGLGLSISQDIIKEHGGTITIESKPDIGTTANIILPAGINGIVNGGV